MAGDEPNMLPGLNKSVENSSSFGFPRRPEAVQWLRGFRGKRTAKHVGVDEDSWIPV
jgi:hypothetical protein